MMRQGQPVNDVAIYLPNDDAYASITLGDVNLRELLVQRVGRDLIPQLLEAGYNFDFFDDDAFKQTGRLDKGALVVGINRYQIVIFPTSKRYGRKPTGALRNSFAVADVDRHRPDSFKGSRAEGLQRPRFDQRDFNDCSRANAPARLVQDVAPFPDTIRKVSTPDVTLLPARAIGFVHRRPAMQKFTFWRIRQTKQTVQATFRTEG
jgi:hypothetical protein